MLDKLCELPFRENEQRVVTKGYLNLQNRTDLLLAEDITADEWMDGWMCNLNYNLLFTS